MIMSKTYLVTKDELRVELLKLMREGVDLNPIGTIISFMGQQPPTLYLCCDGGQHLIDEYQELADFIVVNFGAVNYFGGDGERYFAVPDLRGEFLRGAGVNGHENQGNGADVGKHQDATELTYMFTSAKNKLMQVRGLHGASEWEIMHKNHDKVTSITRSYTNLLATNAASDANHSGDLDSWFSTRPANTSVLFCIKAKTGDEQ